MSRICDFCGKGALTGNLRSKSKVAVKTLQRPNLQRKTIDGKKVSICTQCLKTKSLGRTNKIVKQAPLKLKGPKTRRTKRSAK